VVVDAEVDPHDVRETRHEQSRADEQHDGERHFADDERAPETLLRDSRRRATASIA
jgi:hypothetical protein